MLVFDHSNIIMFVAALNLGIEGGVGLQSRLNATTIAPDGYFGPKTLPIIVYCSMSDNLFLQSQF